MQSRRDIIRTTGRMSAGCIAHVTLASACSTADARAQFTRARHSVIAETPFAHLDLIASNTWALISTTFDGDRTPYSNGGIIAGRTGVAVVEGFYKPAGAQWLAEHARRLTGRWPTHVVLAHYHTDHSGGLAGYHDEATKPQVYTTARTRNLALAGGPVAPAIDEGLRRAFADVIIIPGDTPQTIDRGGRTLELLPLHGHTDGNIAIIDHNESYPFRGRSDLERNVSQLCGCCSQRTVLFGEYSWENELTYYRRRTWRNTRQCRL